MPNVFISGAGPVGLSAALALVDRGHQVTIVDRADGTTKESRAVGVNANSLRLLEGAGVGARIRAEAAVVRRVRFMKSGKRFAVLRLPRTDRPIPPLVALAQRRTERLMEDALDERGITVGWRTALTEIKQDTHRVIATLKGPDGVHHAQADYGLGADGSRSRTREALGIAFEGSTLPEDWALVDAKVDWPFAEEACALLSDDGRIVFMITLADGTYRLIGNHPDVLQQASAVLSVREVLWQSTFNVHLRVADGMAMGRIALAGDAAHTHSPVGGQGMNLGIADAFAFADAVTAGDLAAYGRTRHAAARRIVARTTFAYRLLSAKGIAGRSMRNVLLKSVAGVSGLRAA